MENKRAGQPETFDPQADLDLLARSKSSVAVNDALDFGPWWYAPLLATCVGGLTLFGQEFGALVNIFYGVLGFGAGAIMGIHDYQRRSVRPKFSGRLVGLVLAIIAVCWVLVGAWGTAVSTIGYDNFVPLPALAAWLLTAGLFLVIRHVSHSVLARRTVLA